MAKFNFESFLKEYPDAKKLTLSLVKGETLNDIDIAETFEEVFGKLVITEHLKTKVIAIFSTQAAERFKEKEVNDD